MWPFNIICKIIANKTSSILKESHQVGLVSEMKKCYRLNVTPMKIPAGFFFFKKLTILTSIRKYLDWPKKKFKKKNKTGELSLSWFWNLL